MGKDRCPVCRKKDNEDVAGARWVECSKCGQWFHVACLMLDPVPSADETWLCLKCVKSAKPQSTIDTLNPIAADNMPNNGENRNASELDVNSGATMSAAPADRNNGVTTVNADVDDVQQLKIINDLVKQQEKLVELKQKQLNLMEKLSGRSSISDINEWLKNNHVENCNGNNSKVADAAVTRSMVNVNKPLDVPRDGSMGNLLKTQMQLMCRQYLQDLPTFDGDPEFWPIFYNQLESTTIQGGFDNAHNLCRLRKSLKGEALEAVKGILSLPDSYEQVMQILKKRFGNIQVLVRRKLRHLTDLPAIQENKPETTRRFYEHIQGLQATLVSAEAHEYLCSPQTLDTVVNKVPPSIMRSWIIYKKKQSGKISINNFIDFFEPYYDCAILQEPVKTDSGMKKSSGRVNVHNDIERPPTPHEESKNCSFCRGNHAMAECKKFENSMMRTRWQIVRKKRLCFNCLGNKHDFKTCSNVSSCRKSGCNEKYHCLLHRCTDGRAKKNVKEVGSAEGVNFNAKDSVMKTYFRVLPVTLSNPVTKVSVVTWAFLDEGSSPTMMSCEVAQQLQISGETDELCTSWTNGSISKDPSSQRISINIAGVGMKRSYMLHNVRTVKDLNLPTPSFDLRELKKKYDFLKDVQMPDVPFSAPTILIGLEHPKMGMMFEIREGASDQIVASRCRLGWALHGKDNNAEQVEYSCTVCECSDDCLHEAVKAFYTTEAFGVRSLTPLQSKEDELARQILHKTTRRIGKKFETGLLWREENIKLPENKGVALQRLKCFELKLNRNPDLKAAVMEKIESHLKQGYLTELNDDELQMLSHKRHWYLPIFVVTNPNKLGKIRLVFDAAARCGGVSLNDVLLKGPDQLSSLYGVLLRFREGKIAISADIMEMFHRVNIIKDDQYCQLVLWRNCDQMKEPTVYKMTVMTFGSTCSPCSAQYVKNTNALSCQKEFPRAVEAIVTNHYVDEVLDSFDSSQEALKVASEIREIHERGGFQIRDWISNEHDLMMKMNGESVTKTHIDLAGKEKTEVQRVLGLFWDTLTDEFNFKLCFAKVDPDIIEKRRIPTKREILRLVMSIFDPLGFLTIVTSSAKILLSEVWRSGVNWDEMIPSELVTYWHNWLEGLKRAAEVRIPRCLKINGKQVGINQIHIFCDSSQEAFASVAYLVVREEESNNVHVRFITAKSRVAPQKSLSIPRLELQGCLMGARLQMTLRKELSITVDDVILWSDSRTALGWIRSLKRKYSAFISHRVGEILDLTMVHQWHWVPGQLNVADDATRGLEVPNIPARWLRGPEFLWGEIDEWPVEENPVTDTEVEMKQTVAFSNQGCEKYIFIQDHRFSKWERLLRTISYVLRYIHYVRKVCKDRRLSEVNIVMNEGTIFDKVSSASAITSFELNSAETILIKKMQLEEYGEEIRMLKKFLPVSKNSKIYNLNPYLDDQGVIRLRGRIDAAPSIVSEETKRPIILAQNHHITELISDKVHRQFQHRSKESVINHLRERFWIPKIRVHVNSMISKCNMCKYLKARPAVPQMAKLPHQRLAPNQPPFTFTGIDFFGPVEVTIGRRREKRWGVLFSCLSCRAIHMELASTLDTSSAIMAIRNFMNRRGPPLEFLSDNGTNLKGAEKELKLAVQRLDFKHIQHESTIGLIGESHIKWTFIPPAAPHFGGAWERMIGTIKGSLYLMLKSKAPREETLRSTLIEIENLVNSRPLHYSSTDIDTPSAITPNMLLRGSSREVGMLPSEFDCRKQWVISQAMADEFWSRWLREYLTTISMRRKWYDESVPIEVGQLVLIVDENTRRGDWRRGMVTKIFPSSDGRIRSVEVRTAKAVYVRPVVKLAVIKDLVSRF